MTAGSCRDPVGVVHLGLGGRQRRLATRAVPEHAVALVDQALVPQRLEGPHDGLHVVQVEGLVVVVEVDPAGLPGDVLLPLVGVPQDRFAAGVVERLDAHPDDLGLVLDAELAFGLDLGRQPVGVPAEPSLDPMTAHGLVARHDVLDVAGQQVAVVRQAVGERRTVVEDVLVGAVLPGRACVDRCLERLVLGPVGQDLLFDGGKIGMPGDLGRRRPADSRCARHPPNGDRRVRWCRSLEYSSSLQSPYLQGRAAIGVDRVPRYHPACPDHLRATHLPAVTGRTRSVLVRITCR